MNIKAKNRKEKEEKKIMSRLSKLPKDLLVKLLEEVENVEQLSDEIMKERIEKYNKELKRREIEKLSVKTKEKNIHIKNILEKLIDIIPSLKKNREEYLKVIQDGKEGKWEFIFDKRNNVRFYVKSDAIKVELKSEIFNGAYYTSIPYNYLEFFTILDDSEFHGMTGTTLVGEIEDYLTNDADKYNIFASEGELVYKSCKYCNNCQLSNFGYEKKILFYDSQMGRFGKFEFFKESQINDNSICTNCL